MAFGPSGPDGIIGMQYDANERLQEVTEALEDGTAVSG